MFFKIHGRRQERVSWFLFPDIITNQKTQDLTTQGPETWVVLLSNLGLDLSY